MLQADVSMFVWFGAAMLIGFAVFVVMLIAFAFRAVRAVFDSLRGRCRPERRLARAGRQQLVCPHARCGHINARRGVYCSRCGRPLDRGSELDAYG